VLVVEDDASIAEAVVYALHKDGMSAASVSSLAAARASLAECDLLVLDLGLPDGSGFSLLLESHRLPSPPRFIVLTSRDEEADCVAALEAGADDFVTKPFSPRALVARVRATLRRGAAAVAGASRASAAATAAELHVDDVRRRAFFEGKEMPLTKIEFDLLRILSGAPGRVWTREQLVERVWGDAYALTPRTVDSHLKGLRRKLVDAGASDRIIETVRSVGFRLRESLPAQAAPVPPTGEAP
jgi:two-component system catabolic regulation response regulator CreB